MSESPRPDSKGTSARASAVKLRPLYRMRLSPTIKASVALHGAAALGAFVAPAAWPWAAAAVLGNHALLMAAGLLPRSQWLGANITCLPQAAVQKRQIAITIDDGPDPAVTPQVLDALDAARAKATFFCIGHRARAHPALCREIVARGHRVENHGDSHSHAFAVFGPTRMRADIQAAQETLIDITGQAPAFFRPTAGLRNPFLDPVLQQLNLRLASWSRRGYDTQTGEPKTVLARLTRCLAPGDVLLLHDGHSALTTHAQPVVLAVLPVLLHTLAERGLECVTLHHALSPQHPSALVARTA